MAISHTLVDTYQVHVYMLEARTAWMVAKFEATHAYSINHWSACRLEAKKAKQEYRNMACWLAYGLYGSQAKML